MFDLDGVIYLDDEAIPGAAEAVRGVRELGARVAFVTNNAVRPPAAVVAKLDRLGVKATVEEVLTSAQATVRLLGGPPLDGLSVLVVGGDGLRLALEAAGARLLAPRAWRDAQVVVAGLDPDLDYDRLRAAVLAVAAGARFVGSNPDASLPTPEGPWPGAGSILALLETATGVRPEVAGKPERALFETVAAALGPGPYLMVGDRPDTDLDGARALGWGTALVLTGVARPENLLDLAAAPDHLLAGVPGVLEAPGPAVCAVTEAGGRVMVEAAGAGEAACRWSGAEATLDRVEVRPQWRGRLLGTRLLLAACVVLRAAGVRRLRATPPEGGERFLTRLGFSPGAGPGPGPTLARDL